MANLFETIAADEQFTLLAGFVGAVDAATEAGIADILGAPGADLTIFAPTDDALTATARALGYVGTTPDGVLPFLLTALDTVSGGDPAALGATILLYHAVPVALTPADFAADDLAGAATALGPMLSFGNGTLIDLDPDNADADIGAFTATDNGSLFAIDQLLLPVDLTLADSDGDFTGGDGDELIGGTDGPDRIFAGDGNDTVEGGTGPDQLFGQEGDDLLEGRRGADTLNGGSGNDTLNGRGGADFASGNSGNDRILGQGGADTLLGRTGNDTILGGGGADRIDGEEDNDRLVGGGGNDLVFGRTGDDTLIGGAGNDFLQSGQGDDILRGGKGADLLESEGGSNRLAGGPGADVFEFRLEPGASTVTDFGVGRDRLSLDDDADYTFVVGAGDGDDLLITSVDAPGWSVLILDIDGLEPADFV